jgi:protein-S-isoprenylcysteine O-methyltransferase Ste14
MRRATVQALPNCGNQASFTTMTIRRGIRPSTTHSTTALWVKSLLNAVLFFLVFMTALPLLAHWLLPGRLPLPAWLRILAGCTLILAGGAVWIVCLDVFSRRGGGTPFPLDAPRQLVTSGPYAVVRNPLMVGELAVIWGEAIYVASLGLWLYAGLITLAAHLATVFVEEPELRERFGAAYDAYCRRVPRWLPAAIPRSIFYRGSKPTPLGKALNDVWARLFGVGVLPDFLVTLEVTARRSKRAYTIPLVAADFGGQRYLVSMLGESDWVRNVRAAGGRATLRRHGRQAVRLEDVPIPERPAILQAYLRRAPGARPHFPLTADAPLEAFADIAGRYPVFRIMADAQT